MAGSRLLLLVWSSLLVVRISGWLAVTIPIAVPYHNATQTAQTVRTHLQRWKHAQSSPCKFPSDTAAAEAVDATLVFVTYGPEKEHPAAVSLSSDLKEIWAQQTVDLNRQECFRGGMRIVHIPLDVTPGGHPHARTCAPPFSLLLVPLQVQSSSTISVYSFTACCPSCRRKGSRWLL